MGKIGQAFPMWEAAPTGDSPYRECSHIEAEEAVAGWHRLPH